jgi:hypothetical protein
MVIEITTLSEMNCFALSHSAFEGGENAGQNTWNASKKKAENTPLLNTPEKLQVMRDFARESGGWNKEEIAEWSENELNALFLQWVSGDVRELGADSLDEIDWEEAEEMQSEGQVASNIFKGDDGKIYFYIGN